MKKIAFVSCDDLSSYVVDDEIVFNLLNDRSDVSYDVVSWSDDSVEWSDYDLAILRTTWDYTKNLDSFLKKMVHIESKVSRLLNSKKTIEWNAEKTYLQTLSENGVSIIPSIFLKDETDYSLSEKIKDDIKYVLKPVVGASANDIKVLMGKELLVFLKSLEIKSRWFVQPFLEEVLQGEKSLIFFNREFSHGVKKVPKANDFRVQEEHGGLITFYHPTDEEFKFAKLALDQIEDDQLLYGRVDFISTQDGPKLIELELIEPSLYFRTQDQAASNFVSAIDKFLL